MLKSLKKAIAVLMAVSLVTVNFVGCGKDNSSQSSTATTSVAAVSSSDASTTEVTTKEPVTLKFAVSNQQSTQDSYKLLWPLIEKNLPYVKVEPTILPGEGVDFNKKLTISLMAGDEFDLFYENNTSFQKFADGGLIVPLDDMIASRDYDVAKIYGSSCSKYKDKIYMLPAFKDVHVTLYNKTLFDAANIPYPDNNTWTWDKYVEAAKAITNVSKGIYGSYMLDWDSYLSFSAKQKKVPAYKADGTSNFDDPAWAESFKFFADLGNVLKVQPDYITWSSKKMPWDDFLSSGKYGMFVVGHWAAQTAMDTKQYPRDWKLGIARMPQVNSGEKISLSVIGGYCVASSSKHKEDAFEAVKVLAEQQWTLGNGVIPCRIDLTDEQIETALKPMADAFKNDGITIQELKDAILDPGLDLVNEKVVGPGMTKIIQLFTSEGGMYASGQKSLEATMKDFKEKADQAIIADK